MRLNVTALAVAAGVIWGGAILGWLYNLVADRSQSA